MTLTLFLLAFAGVCFVFAIAAFVTAAFAAVLDLWIHR